MDTSITGQGETVENERNRWGNHCGRPLVKQGSIEQLAPGIRQARKAPVAAVRRMVRISPLLWGQITTVDGGVSMFPQGRQHRYVQQVGRGPHVIDYCPKHLHLVRI